jgi:hypothetical protein
LKQVRSSAARKAKREKIGLKSFPKNLQEQQIAVTPAGTLLAVTLKETAHRLHCRKIILLRPGELILKN